MVERIIRPAFLDIGMTLVQEEARLDAEIKDILGVEQARKIREVRKAALQRTADTIQSKYNEAKNQAIGFMQG
jgi:hypothetical protein